MPTRRASEHVDCGGWKGKHQVSEEKNIMSNFTLTTKKCGYCGDVNVGTMIRKTADEDGEFACANCDRENFEALSELQKQEYLAGSSSYTC